MKRFRRDDVRTERNDTRRTAKRRGMTTAGITTIPFLLLAGAAAAKGGQDKPVENLKPFGITRALGVGCVLKGGEGLVVGNELWIGVTSRAMYGMKIKEISGDNVTIDLIMPVGSPLPGPTISSTQVRFNDVEVGRYWIENLAKAMCSKKIGDASTVFVSDSKKEDGDIKSLDSSKVKNHVKQLIEGSLKMLVGSIGSFSAGSYNEEEQEGNFVVVKSTDKEFVLRVKGGEYDGKEVKLSREAGIMVEFITEEAGYYHIPYSIESLTVNEGNVEVQVDVDTSRTVRMDIPDG